MNQKDMNVKAKDVDVNDIKVDVNNVVDILTIQIAQMSKDIAILKASNESLQDVNKKQEKLIKSYEEKENVTRGKALP